MSCSMARWGVRASHASVDMNMNGVLSVRTDALTLDDAYGPDPIALYTRQVEAFDASLEGGSALLATGLDGLRVVEITLAMVESARTGRRVRAGVGSAGDDALDPLSVSAERTAKEKLPSIRGELSLCVRELWAGLTCRSRNCRCRMRSRHRSIRCWGSR